MSPEQEATEIFNHYYNDSNITIEKAKVNSLYLVDRILNAYRFSFFNVEHWLKVREILNDAEHTILNYKN